MADLLTTELAALRKRVAALEAVEAPALLDIADRLAMLNVTTAVDDHFRASALGSDWTWAGAPFVTPTVTLSNSALRATGLTGSQRSFAYRTSFSTASWALAQSISSLSVGFAGGFRLDDGSDNNYAEAVVRVSQSTPTQWQYQVRWRTGGGVVSTANGNTLVTPVTSVLVPSRSGTAWSSWGLAFVTTMLPSLGGFHWNPNSAVSGLTWTPTRAGILIDGGGSASSFNTVITDWARIS